MFDIMGYVAGLTKLKYRNFLLAVSLSSIINVPIYVAIGKGFIENPNIIPSKIIPHEYVND